jgi:hypothetical protein
VEWGSYLFIVAANNLLVIGVVRRLPKIWALGYPVEKAAKINIHRFYLHIFIHSLIFINNQRKKPVFTTDDRWLNIEETKKS